MNLPRPNRVRRCYHEEDLSLVQGVRDASFYLVVFRSAWSDAIALRRMAGLFRELRFVPSTF